MFLWWRLVVVAMALDLLVFLASFFTLAWASFFILAETLFFFLAFDSFLSLASFFYLAFDFLFLSSSIRNELSASASSLSW